MKYNLFLLPLLVIIIVTSCNDRYEEGYDEGYDEGYEEGKDDAYYHGY